MFKEGGTESEYETKVQAMMEVKITTHNMTDQQHVISDLQDRLRFANETIAMLMDETGKKLYGDEILNISDNISEGQESDLSI